MSSEILNLQQILSRTPEEIEADNAEQEKNRLRVSAHVPNSAEKTLYLHSLGTERDARANIDSIVGGLQERRTSEQHEILLAALAHFQSKLAESLFWQGRFAEAVGFEAREQQKHEYKNYLIALDRLNATVCECPPIRTAGGHSAKGIATPARRVVQTVFIEKLDKSVDFIKCESCKSLFAASK